MRDPHRPFVHIRYAVPTSLTLRVTIEFPADCNPTEELQHISDAIAAQRTTLGNVEVDLVLLVRETHLRETVRAHVIRTVGGRFRSVRLG